ncbi:MAG: channel protein TolC [Burkholderiales bacterium PBB3]|nr:MAG: channel protein TolC [Burkholderiales bacterium PBB3]
MKNSKALHRFTLIPMLAALAAVISPAVQAQSLVDLYTAARGYDATFQSAKSNADATLARADQARAGILPSASLTANANRTNTEAISKLEQGYGSQTVTLGASQPLYRPANWVTYEQGKKQAELAQMQLNAAEQDLIVRVCQAYFDVLAATDSLAYLKSLKTATSEQLASAKRNFEVGTSTITDSREAQARYDLVIAQELAADNDLRVKSLALDTLVGRSNTSPQPLALPAVLPTLPMADMEQWVVQSQDNHPSIQQAKVALEVARLETQKARAGHKPTVDLVGSYSMVNNNGTFGGGAADSRVNNAAIGVNFNLPLFAGFSIQNRVRETVSLEDKAKSDLDIAQRGVAQGTRAAFLGVISGAAQVKAFEAAEASTQSALDANKLGYQVGVRINIDVLNSQSQLFDTKAKLAKARYDVLVGGLRLRQAGGVLKAEDLQPINGLLKP